MFCVSSLFKCLICLAIVFWTAVHSPVAKDKRETTFVHNELFLSFCLLYLLSQWETDKSFIFSKTVIALIGVYFGSSVSADEKCIKLINYLYKTFLFTFMNRLHILLPSHRLPIVSINKTELYEF